jgi:demethylmenaquinone methyltransferase/2-methoxy-6-polyprenyl-1,4-benzoquinol methylase
MLEIARDRLVEAKVRFIQADVFDWRPDAHYDVVFFSFWMTHVPADRFQRFWGLVGEALNPGGRVFFIDNTAEDILGRLADRYDGLTVLRSLKDGRGIGSSKWRMSPTSWSTGSKGWAGR